jgi:hypothetical protein
MTSYMHVGLDEPAKYIIKFQGRFTTPPQDWFTGEVDHSFEVNDRHAHVTTLNGVIPDQAALHGLLRYLRDLGLTLLYVDCISARAKE